MKTLKHVLLGLLALLLLASVAGIFLVRHLARRALPDLDATLALPILDQEVRVYRDAEGIPHIHAQNEADLYRAVGYVMAQDRLWQMDLLRRVTQGRLSQIFGKDMVSTDLLMRALRIEEKSKGVIAQTDPSIVAALDAYCQGVNAYIDQNADRLPPEFALLGYEPEHWKPEHSVNLVGYMAWDLNSAWDAEVLLHKIAQQVDTAMLAELVPDLDRQTVASFRDFRTGELGLREDLERDSRPIEELGLGIFNGSNNWAVSGAKSQDGMPILSNDMHLGLFAPGIWYPMHQYVEGKVNVTGVALPGQPLIVAGHNQDIAWGMTNVMIDDLDFYQETVNPENPGQYLFNGQWVDFMVRTEAIATQEGEVVLKELRFTHRGPVVSELHGVTDKVISMRWMGNQPSNEFRSVYLLNRARDWNEFREALRTFRAVSQNVVYADNRGNIGLQCAAGIPLREGDGMAILPGQTDRYDWKGVVPFEEQPFEYNPPRGYVASANNRTVGPDYPHHISHWFDLPYRIDRIRQMLEAKDKLSVEDFKAMLADHNSPFSLELRDLIVEYCNPAQLGPQAADAYALVKSWDGHTGAESAPAAITELFFLNFVTEMAREHLDDELARELLGFKILVRNLFAQSTANPGSPWFDRNGTAQREELKDWVPQVFEATVAQLDERLGKEPADWQWGELHQLQLRHPMGKVRALAAIFRLNSEAFPVGGSFHTVNPYAFPLTDSSFTVTHGASHRHIYTTSDWNLSQTILPTGTSGIPASPHYCDQTERYANNQFHPDWFDLDVVRREALHTTVLKP